MNNFIDTTIRPLAATLGAVVVIAISACVVDDDAAAGKSVSATPIAVDTTGISAPSYEAYASDTIGAGERMARFAAYDSSFKLITPQAAEAKVSKFPATIPPEGPSTLHLQILLDRANFSPGIIDGMWGDNAAKALRWFRFANGIDTTSVDGVTDSTAVVDQATYQKLVGAAAGTPLIARYTVTADDADGPFVDVPEKVYDQAKLKCLCYSSVAEALAEKFHTSKRMLAQLNPGVSLDSLAAGTQLAVPNVAGTSAASRTPVTQIVVSKKNFWLHGLDAGGRIVWHAPSTLGAGYDPSPDAGDYKVTNIAKDPTFHYQPTLFAEVPDSRPTAMLPAGPNSPVGVVWMALSKPHFGIHGTSSPETIGYANSHGCVRLTNWDARELSSAVQPGTVVKFQ